MRHDRGPIRPIGRRAFLGGAALGVVVLLGACSSAPEELVPPGPDEARRVASMMTGWFDSADQARDQPDDFYDIRLVMVPVWPERTDGPWLYVEQAASDAAARPYRQRVYHLVQNTDGTIRSDVLTLPGDPLERAGCWRDEHPLGDLTPRDLEPRDGCSITLRRVAPSTFVGATTGAGCPSTLRGASYATSEVEVQPDRLTSWDRGFDASGVQAWGATAGAYVFVKRSIGPPD